MSGSTTGPTSSRCLTTCRATRRCSQSSPPVSSGAHDDLVLPSVSRAIDWEVELAVVIGRRVRRATLEEAQDAIAGFTIANDVSMRDWQSRTSQYLQGKAFDASTPVGPVLVTGDEIGDAADLEVRCEVDGVEMQRGRTSDLMFGPAAAVELYQPVRDSRPR